MLRCVRWCAAESLSASRQLSVAIAGFVPGVLAPKNERNGGGSAKVKQADAVLLGFPYDANMSNEVRRGCHHDYDHCVGEARTSWVLAWLLVVALTSLQLHSYRVVRQIHKLLCADHAGLSELTPCG